MRALIYVAATSLLVSGVLPQPTKPAPTSIRAIQPYRSWHCTTPQPVDMAPRMAISCVAPARWDTSPLNPHVPRVFKVYVNPVGKAVMLSAKPMTFPAGSIIVKEKYAVDPPRKEFDITPAKIKPGAKPELLTVMVKREKGFAPANGDWEYLTLTGDLQEATTEGLQHCVKCHNTASQRDYIWTRKLESGFPSRYTPEPNAPGLIRVKG